MEFHSILSKQIKKLLPEKYLADPELHDFLESVSNSYYTFEKSKKFSLHSAVDKEADRPI